MEILNPRRRKEKLWQQKQQKAQKIQNQIELNKKITFREYCQYSQWILDAPPIHFDEKEYLINFMCSAKDKIDYGNKIDAEKQQGRKIIALISYAWDHAFRLMGGMNQTGNESDPLKIYSEEHLNLQLARIQKMLNEIKGKKYRFQNYYKKEGQIGDNEQNQKQIKEQIDFTKLLRSILSTQINRIQSNRNNINIIQRQALQPAQPQIKQKIIPEKTISEIINVDAYFKRKIERIQALNVHKNELQDDPISKYEEQRKFNMAAVRYHAVIRKS